MTIPVVFKTYKPGTDARGYWDQGMIEDLISQRMWAPGLTYEYQTPVNGVDVSLADMAKEWDGLVLVIPARHNATYIGRINQEIKRFKWVVLILTGDEEGDFDITKLEHPNMKLWIMQPIPGRDKADFFMGSGYPPHARKLIAENHQAYLDKPLDWYFAGQVTHARRHEAVDVLEGMLEREDIKGDLVKSEGFTQGIQPKHYYELLTEAKAAPCPSGPASPDSFRVFEALEAGAVPIADDRPPIDYPDGYWRNLLGDVPFKILTDYNNLEGYICDIQREFPVINNRTFAWWQGYKRAMSYTLRDQIHELSGLELTTSDPRNLTTVLIPTSPVPANPSTAHIEKTVEDVRAQLPTSEIIIMIDGVREEQSDRLEGYNEYIRRLLWLCNHKWSNVMPLLFEEHQHQANMTCEALKLVSTPTITFVEHDAPLVPDEPIEWESLITAITSGEANVIRFHFEGVIPEPHRHLMIESPVNIRGAMLQRTAQWSQRPHIASTAFYRNMIDIYFGSESRTMIEDVIHGVVDSAFREEGIMGWNLFRLWIYHPAGGNIKRSYHIDARGKDPKYGMKIAYTGETPRFAPDPKVTDDEPGK